MTRRSKIRKEDIAEGCCFVCKDGGLLMLCDYKDCFKAYHPKCVGKDDLFLQSDDRWTCRCHSCFICLKTSKFHCFCCPIALCGRCICDAEFAIVRGNRGFCRHCLRLAELIEKNVDADSDGGKIDFNDRDTYECLFKEYWNLIKGKDCLTAEHVHAADNLLKKGKNYGSGSILSKIDEDEGNSCEVEEDSHFIVSDYDDLNDMDDHKTARKRRRSNRKLCIAKRKVQPKKKEFIGWGSKCLIDFLESIGSNTTEQLSQYDITSLIIRYCEENKLFHPEKKKTVQCDAKLQSLLGRKYLNKNKIHDRLECHFAENLEESGEDEIVSSSENHEFFLPVGKRHRKSSNPEENVVQDVKLSSFASVSPVNICLVYLKRTVVEELLKQPETFEGKVMGCFVRIRSDPYDIYQKNSHVLLQVKGIKKTSHTYEISSEIFLQVFNMPKDVPICKLSDDDFSEEECEDLHQRVKQGLLKWPSFVELQQKAKSLHHDIKKHWIARELVRLQNLIDWANEKGRRKELLEYIDRKRLLNTPLEQIRLLDEVPEVIASIIEHEPALENSPMNNFKGCETSCLPNSGTDATEEKHCQVPVFQEQTHVSPLLSSVTRIHSPEASDDKTSKDWHHSAPEVNKHISTASLQDEIPKSNTFLHHDQSDIVIKKHHQCGPYNSGEKQTESSDVKEATLRNQIASTVEVIELSTDDEQEEQVTIEKQTLDDSIWHCVGPLGERRGPYSMSLLKLWRDSSPKDMKFKVWKTGQSQEEAIFLTEAILKAFPEK